MRVRERGTGRRVGEGCDDPSRRWTASEIYRMRMQIVGCKERDL